MVPSARTSKAVAREIAAAGRSAVAEDVSLMGDSDLPENRNVTPKGQATRTKRREAALTGAAAIGNGTFRHGERGQDSVVITDVEQHAFAQDSGHFARFQ